jgi:hypothetical protein
MIDVDIKFCKNNCGTRTAHPDGVCGNCKNKIMMRSLIQCKEGFVN